MRRDNHDRESESLDRASRNRDHKADIAAPLNDGFADPMSDVLDSIRLRGALFFLWEPSWPYGVGVADGRKLSRHIVPEARIGHDHQVVDAVDNGLFAGVDDLIRRGRAGAADERNSSIDFGGDEREEVGAFIG